jgi:hypothetical protein
MSHTTYNIQFPTSYGRNLHIADMVKQHTKSLIYVHPALIVDLIKALKEAGIPTFSFLCHLGSKAAKTLKDYHQAPSGVLVTTIHDNTGYKLEGASLVLFVELHLIRNSGLLEQAIARARHNHVTVVYLNCNMTRSLNPPRLSAEPDPNKRHAHKIVRPDRKPFVYKSKDHHWRVQIGKWNNTFGSYEEARRFAVLFVSALPDGHRLTTIEEIRPERTR